MKNIVLTGGTGFIGNATVKTLLSLGFRVTVLTRNPKKNKEKNLSFLYIDFSDPNSFSNLKNKLPGQCILLDMGAHIPSSGVISTKDYFEQNFIHHCLFVEMFKENIKKIVYLSTIDVYGSPKGNVYKEDQTKSPETVYGLSKSLLEEYYLFFQKGTHIPVTILRLSQVYGNNAHPFNALPKFLFDSKRKKPLVLFGKGEEQRTYIHIQGDYFSCKVFMFWCI